MGRTGKGTYWLVGLIGSLMLISIILVSLNGRSLWPFVPNSAAASSVGDDEGRQPQTDDESQILVRTLKPKRDPAFVLTIRELAYVEPYYQASLMSQVAGRVKFVQRDIGDPISEGEVLVEIDAPDALEELALKEAGVEQATREERLAQKKVGIAEAAVEVAWDNLLLKRAMVAQAVPTMEYRRKRWNRFKGAALEKAVDEAVVEEEERDYKAAEEAWKAAQVAEKKALADWEESKANLEAVKADVNLKSALIQVARKARDRALALADYARIRAPFDGEIIERSIDPGSFVQNATTARTEPLLKAARTDIVTVFMKVPENFAPLVSKKVEALVQLDALPAEVITGKVSRYSRSVQDKDRTMRVEVDLYNETQEEYQKFVRKCLVTFLTPLGAARPAEMPTLVAAARKTWGPNRKSIDAFPIFPTIAGEDVPLDRQRLIPGMTGYMTLRLPSNNAYLLPMGAVFSRGGKTFIAQVEDGKAHLVPVEIQAEDGRLAQVVVVTRRSNPKTGRLEVLKKGLTGNEEVIASGQSEIAEGQAVRATPGDWQPN
jgi:multidrug resistance efflux pump